MIQATLLLGYVLLSSVAAFPRNTQNDTLPHQLAVTEPASNLLSSLLPPAPGTCQDLPNRVPSLASLHHHLFLLALRVALESVGCPAEARRLQLQLSGVGGKDTTETLILSQKRSKEEGIDDNVVILRGLGGFPRELKRVQRSVTLPEACTSERGWVTYETTAVLAELAEKLPSTELVREFQASAVNVTQKCTLESWEHLNEVGQRLMRSLELKNASIPIVDQVYFVARFAVLLKRIFIDLLLRYLG